jgi:RNA polymerase sigma factor (sigma-70 family)
MTEHEWTPEGQPDPQKSKTYGDLWNELMANRPGKGNDEFRAYFRLCVGKAHRYLHRRPALKEGASAIVQSAWLDLLKRPVNPMHLGFGDFPWEALFKAVLNHCSKWNEIYQAQKRQRVEVSIHGDVVGEGVIDLLSNEPSPEEAAMASMVESLLQQLNDEQLAIYLHRASGKTQREICQQLRMSDYRYKLQWEKIKEIGHQIARSNADE